MLIFQTLTQWNALTGKVRPRKDTPVLKTKELPQLKNTLSNYWAIWDMMLLQMPISQILIQWNAPTGKEKPKKVTHVLKTKVLLQLRNTPFNYWATLDMMLHQKLIFQMLTQWNALTGRVKPKKVTHVLKTKVPPQLKNMQFNWDTMLLQMLISQTLIQWNALTGKVRPKKVTHALRIKELPQLKNTLCNY